MSCTNINMIFMKKYLTESSRQTFELGKRFASKLNGGDVLLLFGELGAGKTTFVQGLAKGLGIKDRIISPTFILIRQYKIPHPTSLLKGGGNDRKSSRQARTGNLYHIDLYRIENPQDLISLGLSEIFEDPASITVIEWADRLKNFKTTKGYRIFFKHLEGNRREIKIEKL